MKKDNLGIGLKKTFKVEMVSKTVLTVPSLVFSIS